MTSNNHRIVIQCFIHLFHRGAKLLATELESPIESDGKRAEGDDNEGLDEIDDRKQIALHAATHGKMAIETDAQCHERRVDQLTARWTQAYYCHASSPKDLNTANATTTNVVLTIVIVSIRPCFIQGTKVVDFPKTVKHSSFFFHLSH